MNVWLKTTIMSEEHKKKCFHIFSLQKQRFSMSFPWITLGFLTVDFDDLWLVLLRTPFSENHVLGNYHPFGINSAFAVVNFICESECVLNESVLCEKMH